MLREQHLQQSLPNLGAGRFAAAAPIHGYSTATPWAQRTAPRTHSTETGITGIGFCETQTASAINHSTGQDSSWAGKKKDTSEQQSCKLGSVSNLCIHTVFCFGLFFFLFFSPKMSKYKKNIRKNKVCDPVQEAAITCRQTQAEHGDNSSAQPAPIGSNALQHLSLLHTETAARALCYL